MMRLWAIIFLLGFSVTVQCAQGQVSDEDAQEVLEAISEADMAQELPSYWENRNAEKQNDKNRAGLWDTRFALEEGDRVDSLSKFKIQSSVFSARGRWRRNADQKNVTAFTAGLKTGSLNVQLGGVGMSVGYGLLISSPGRSGGLAAGQSLPSQANRIRGWATTPGKRSVVGVGMTWRSEHWGLMGMHGRLGDAGEGTQLSAVFVERQLGVVKTGMSLARVDGQLGASCSGQWQKSRHRFGFEWVLWEGTDRKTHHGVWLISWKMTRILGWAMEVQWSASNGSDGPATGIRPGVLDAWNGAGWAIRISSPSVKSWRLKVLLAESGGKDWVGPHQSQTRGFFDVKIQGRPVPGWEFSSRWHQRIRTWDAWSETYPWLPSQRVKEDRRQGLGLDLKSTGRKRGWVFSLRSLSRQGAATNGRRSLASVRHRIKWGRNTSFLFSFQTAWGDPVDLVSAINPVAGLLLPRHWGHWSSEILAGMERTIWGTRIMVAISRREPTVEADRPPEHCLWAGARVRW